VKSPTRWRKPDRSRCHNAAEEHGHDIVGVLRASFEIIVEAQKRRAEAMESRSWWRRVIPLQWKGSHFSDSWFR
jgi:hypothetical protein